MLTGREPSPEVALAPNWLTEGRLVENVFERSPDAEFIFDDESELWGRLEWKECVVPVGAFGFPLELLDSHVAHFPDQQYEAERLASVRSWITSRGGVEQALREAPILATMRRGVLVVEDGYHRLGVSAIEFGARSVRVLCAEVADDFLRPSPPKMSA